MRRRRKLFEFGCARLSPACLALYCSPYSRNREGDSLTHRQEPSQGWAGGSTPPSLLRRQDQRGSVACWGVTQLRTAEIGFVPSATFCAPCARALEWDNIEGWANLQAPRRQARTASKRQLSPASNSSAPSEPSQLQIYPEAEWSGGSLPHMHGKMSKKLVLLLRASKAAPATPSTWPLGKSRNHLNIVLRLEERAFPEQGLAAHICKSSSTEKAEAGGSPVQGQPGL